MKILLHTLILALVLSTQSSAYADRLNELMGVGLTASDQGEPLLSDPQPLHINMEKKAERILWEVFHQINQPKLTNLQKGSVYGLSGEKITLKAGKDVVRVLAELGWNEEIEAGEMRIESQRTGLSTLTKADSVDGIYTWNINVILLLQPISHGLKGNQRKVSLNVVYVRSNHPHHQHFGAVINHIALENTALASNNPSTPNQTNHPGQAASKTAGTPANKSYLSGMPAKSGFDAADLTIALPSHKGMARYAERRGLRPFMLIKARTIVDYEKGMADRLTQATHADSALQDVVTVLRELGWINEIQQNNMRIRVRGENRASIVDSKVVDGVFTWTVEVPVVFQPFYASDGPAIDPVATTLVIQTARTNAERHRQYSVAVTQIVLKE